ncbi:hypothetical protein P175DRAFT_0530736 [Aspergillus ochraceoroseus IBT 24754]|uniref:Uncharacterized protein n=1 Tax=Aspergillus ochraceoroseus IBT 24754 TaxID=1392256 RepID=A0A2T5M4Y3_9EURO|nr:uncharacterized protein P175DRAFT_0530736 [Aspergillus ochraceoroseus IBT 24754]PTU23601.1 hypothetical protein P175DRAFT_0530736 [Aspergillus ochraceoroseus IBT 24754]
MARSSRRSQPLSDCPHTRYIPSYQLDVAMYYSVAFTYYILALTGPSIWPTSSYPETVRHPKLSSTSTLVHCGAGYSIVWTVDPILVPEWLRILGAIGETIELN